MTVELVCVGTEILLGNIVNTNAAYLAEQCAMLGLSCYHQSVVGDNEQRMEETIRRAVSRSDIVILSGGLGPTKDDLTKEVTAQVFDMELLEDPHTRARIQELSLIHILMLLCFPMISMTSVFWRRSPSSSRCSIRNWMIRSRPGCETSTIRPFPICLRRSIQKLGAVIGLGLLSFVR